MSSSSSSSSNSSSEEEKLVQMVHDFIESRAPSPISVASSQVLSLEHHPTYLTLQGVLGNATDAETVVFKKVFKYFNNVKYERKTCSLKKWLLMRLKRDGFSASLCKSKSFWITTSDCSGYEYEYIDIIVKDESGGSTRLIVDIDFNSQFQLARPTSAYKHLLRSLPSIFVGSEEKLLKIVSILCSAAKQSLKERGLHIPPWRKASYMQSKWISESQKASTTKISGKEAGRVNSKANKGDEDNATRNNTQWSPPKVMPKRRDLGGGSALTIQFSSMSINCC